MFYTNGSTEEYDAVLIGAGIMSATLGALLSELLPDLSLCVLERFDKSALESSDAWNNAGTGHSAFCELNYTPQAADGSVNISKALNIASQFEASKQFWSYLSSSGGLGSPASFIRPVPHISFVGGGRNVSFLKNRYVRLSREELFSGMEYAVDTDTLLRWMPLVMQSRNIREPLAATRVTRGTDVDFGALTGKICTMLASRPGITIHYSTEVKRLSNTFSPEWDLTVLDHATRRLRAIRSKFVFIGAGGASTLLLRASGIAESRGYGGFPVSGLWLKCKNPALIQQHDAKVYGLAAVNAPPMSVPHLDTRVIGGERSLLFGPFAGFSTKFLKQGSYTDLFRSLGPDNLPAVLSTGAGNISLIRYLVGQVLQSPDDRIKSLREFVPQASADDWELVIAGQRVQIIKKRGLFRGKLEFGTEVVCSADGSLAALLGASPGASTAVSAMLELLKRCFAERMNDPEVRRRLDTIIPTWGKSLAENAELCRSIRVDVDRKLGLLPT